MTAGILFRNSQRTAWLSAGRNNKASSWVTTKQFSTAQLIPNEPKRPKVLTEAVPGPKSKAMVSTLWKRDAVVVITSQAEPFAHLNTTRRRKLMYCKTDVLTFSSSTMTIRAETTSSTQTRMCCSTFLLKSLPLRSGTMLLRCSRWHKPKSFKRPPSTDLRWEVSRLDSGSDGYMMV